MNEETYIGSVMRYIRIKHHHSLEEVAPILQIHPAELSQIEQGITSPSLQQIRIFADRYRIPVDVLFQRTAYIQTQQRPVPTDLQEALQEIRLQYKYHSLYDKLSSPFPDFLESLYPIFQSLLPSQEYKCTIHTGEADWSDVPYISVTHPNSSLLVAYVIPRNKKNIHCGIFSDWNQFSLYNKSSLSHLAQHAAIYRPTIPENLLSNNIPFLLNGHSFLSHAMEAGHVTSICYEDIPSSQQLLQDWFLLCSIWNIWEQTNSITSRLPSRTHSPHQAG